MLHDFRSYQDFVKVLQDVKGKIEMKFVHGSSFINYFTEIEFTTGKKNEKNAQPQEFIRNLKVSGKKEAFIMSYKVDFVFELSKCAWSTH